MKLLNGKELMGYIKERQAKQVRRLTQAHSVHPKLLIYKTHDDLVINTYISLKQKYGADIDVDVEIRQIEDVSDMIRDLEVSNNDETIHGIIIQLPLKNSEETENVLASVSVEKDVDGLAPESQFSPATPMSIRWLLDGYNIQLRGRKIVIVGEGRLVGKPLKNQLVELGYDVESANEDTPNLVELTNQADLLISAAGVPGLIKEDMVKSGIVAIDAGVAEASGKTVGDFDESMYQRDDLTITPAKGGVGPLTVAALFENVLIAAEKSIF